MEKIVDDINLPEKELKYSFWDFKGKYDIVDNWFLMGTPYPLLVIVASYLIFVLKIGPEIMKNRRPFVLKKFLLVYNALQVLVSAAMVYLCLQVMLKVGLIHRTCLTDTNEQINRLATLTYYFFLCKISELTDTVLFVLRKKQSQVSFLHVYHHTMMACSSWTVLKYEPGYWLLFLGTLNCFVHTVMYTYYGLSAYPKLRKYLWWKKYITTLQLIQFFLNLIHTTVNYFVNECRQSVYTIIFCYLHLALFIYLFSSFYMKRYSSSNVTGSSSNGTSSVAYNSDKKQQNGGQYNKNSLNGNGMKHRNGANKNNIRSEIS